jgi:hypothetical protein
MPFMVPEITRETFFRGEVKGETLTIPQSGLVGTLVANFPEGLPEVFYRKFWARLSAPGYLDATDWIGPFKTEADARAGLSDAYDVCGECGEDMGTIEGSLCPRCKED